ncbi:fibrinogen-binding protein [Rhizobium binxianense]
MSDDDTKVGALADGFANSAINSTEVDDGSTGYVGGVANGDNRNNTENKLDVDVKSEVDISKENGDNRDNEYDWSYESKSDDDVNVKTVDIKDTDTKIDYDWSYDSKSISDNDTTTINDNDTDVKQISDNDTDIKQISDNDTDVKQTSDNDTTTVGIADSFNKTDTDFAVLEDVKDFSNLGIAGGDLTFNIGDDFSFTLDIDGILNDSLNGQGNDTGFSIVQANHLADQDSAWNIKMDNDGAQNHLKADAGTAYGSDGVDIDGKGWDLKAGDDVAGSTTADASAILANSGFHLELVQGANMLSNTVDSTVVGGNSDIDNVGEDS